MNELITRIEKIKKYTEVADSVLNSAHEKREGPTLKERYFDRLFNVIKEELISI